MTTRPDCGQGNAVLWLSAGVGAAIGLAAVAVRMLFVPYRVHRSGTMQRIDAAMRLARH